MKPWDTRSAAAAGRDSLEACLGAVVELAPEELPELPGAGDAATIAFATRWLAGLGLGLARIADPAHFSWPGPWIARIRPPGGEPRFVVMFGVPSGVVWDPVPANDGPVDNDWIIEGYLVAAADIAQARPALAAAPAVTGRIEGIWISPAAGEPARALDTATALPGRGLDGDRYVSGDGTFGSGNPGSALTLIEAEVCDSFHPPLGPDDHRRNLLTRGLPLNDLVGHDFQIGDVRCRGMRLCEPCTVVQRYAGRPVLRALVHRGGLRADIVSAGEIHVDDEIRAL